MGVGLAGDISGDVDSQVIAALATKDYDVGLLGVTDEPTNFTAFNDPRPSYLSTLKTQSKIPSLSYAYSAGAQYRMSKLTVFNNSVINLCQVRTRPMGLLYWAGMTPQNSYRMMFLSRWQAIYHEI